MVRTTRTTRSNRRQAGFTIIELLIAMMAFSVIMLVVVSVFLQVSKMYTKGVTISRTQESARAVLDDLTREIQFSSSPVVRNPVATVTGDNLNHYCIGGKRYTFKLGRMKSENPSGGTESRHVLQKDEIASLGGCPPATVDPDGAVPDGSEMMIDHTSLTDLDISCTADQVSCQIKLRMTYGDPNDNELFLDEGGKRVCQGAIVGSEFCTVVELNATVTRRLQ